jgi:hypothetical protein
VAPGLAPIRVAPSLGTKDHGVKTLPRQRHALRSWRQLPWRHAVLHWHRRPWRQDKGLFFEIFPSGAYLRESFEKGLKNKKDANYSPCTFFAAFFSLFPCRKLGLRMSGRAWARQTHERKKRTAALASGRAHLLGSVRLDLCSSHAKSVSCARIRIARFRYAAHAAQMTHHASSTPAQCPSLPGCP